MMHQTRWFMLVIPLLGIVLLGGCSANKRVSDFNPTVLSATQVYEDNYEAAIAAGNSEEEADRIAKKAARNHDDPRVDSQTRMQTAMRRNPKTGSMTTVAIDLNRMADPEAFYWWTGGIGNLMAGFRDFAIGSWHLGWTKTREQVQVDYRGVNTGTLTVGGEIWNHQMVSGGTENWNHHMVSGGTENWNHNMFSGNVNVWTNP